MIRTTPGLTGKAAPTPIDPNCLFNVDLDESIWQDCGLGDDGDGDAPSWAADESVREGIRWMLELDRCNEERERLMDERSALQEWFMEEWECVVQAKRRAGMSRKIL